MIQHLHVKGSCERPSMKTFILLSIAVYSAIAGPVDIKEEYLPFNNLIRDDYGVLHKIESISSGKVLEKLERNPDNNAYYLFTREHPVIPERLLEDADSILQSAYDPQKTTIVSVHGFRGEVNAPNNILLRNTYLGKSDVNVIILDWSELAAGEYMAAATGLPLVGRRLGQFIQLLVDVTGASLDNFHLIGFSLGAHVVGNAGRQLNGRVARVTGLDPAGGHWSREPTRIMKTDGVYVEGIHTDSGSTGVGIGYLTTIGHADFYPNGGAEQPGCNGSSQCNHNRAWEQLAGTIVLDHLVGRECWDVTDAITGNCRGNTLHMGNEDLTKSGTGIYRVNTGSQFPF